MYPHRRDPERVAPPAERKRREDPGFETGRGFQRRFEHPKKGSITGTSALAQFRAIAVPMRATPTVSNDPQ
jgi:hypothetical protein